MVNSGTRFFILTPGRTGSSLLAAVLADCGADFGMTVDDWDQGGGAYEDRDATRAARHAVAMYRYGPSPQHPERLLWLWHRRRARRCLARALRRCGWVKVMHAHMLLGLAAQMGYDPRVVVSTRDIEGYLNSSAGTFGRRLHGHIMDDYTGSLENGRLAIRRYGGTEIDFSELTDPAAAAWADRLGEVCSIAPLKLITARDRCLKPARSIVAA